LTSNQKVFNFKEKLNMKKRISYILIALIIVLFQMHESFAQKTIDHPIVDTDQQKFYDTIIQIVPPSNGDIFFGQDANYTGYVPSYLDNENGTVTDLVTGLMWQKSPDMDGDGDIDYDDKMSYFEAIEAVTSFDLAGYTDWRLPNIKELYSLIIFSGVDPSGYTGTSTDDLIPFIDTGYFDFAYGDQNAGERIIDAQMASSTIYVGTTMMGDHTMFGVNFADGRIKGYPTGPLPGQNEDKQFYVMYVRGDTGYGSNDYQDNGNGTVTDRSSGLMWAKNDNGSGMIWEDALDYAENTNFADHSNWRLPNTKELQSILDYTRSPSTTNSPAIDPIFNCSEIIDEGGNTNYPFYWSGTTHVSWFQNNEGRNAAYVCFGEALGWMQMPPNSGNYVLLDVHGAGSQRSDPKTGNPDNYPYGHGPQGDVVRIFNYVRLVRDADTTLGLNENGFNDSNIQVYPNPVNNILYINNNSSEYGEIKITDINGRVMYTLNVSGHEEIKVNINNLPRGIYIIAIKNSSGYMWRNIIKQ
jgi:hypothetical protein